MIPIHIVPHGGPEKTQSIIFLYRGEDEGVAARRKKDFTYTNHDVSLYEKIGER